MSLLDELRQLPDRANERADHWQHEAAEYLSQRDSARAAFREFWSSHRAGTLTATQVMRWIERCPWLEQPHVTPTNPES